MTVRFQFFNCCFTEESLVLTRIFVIPNYFQFLGSLFIILRTRAHRSLRQVPPNFIKKGLLAEVLNPLKGLERPVELARGQLYFAQS